MQLFYNPEINTTTENFFFGKEESGHIVKVMRRNSGDILMVTNGLGNLFTTEIILASASKCAVKILKVEDQQPLCYELHIAVAPTKMNDRYEWFLEKATEIGVNEITPIICEHSERRNIKTDRFEKIVLAAMKQSTSCYLPKINEPISFKEFIKEEYNGLKLIAHCEETEKKLLKDVLVSNSKILILIGPEGDFTTNEIKLALENKFTPFSLGNARLRTETAAVVACTTVSIINQ